MWRVFYERLRQKHRTIGYPADPAALPDRFRGRPILDDAKCPDGCRECIDACPTDAIAKDAKGLALDTGRCLFCTDCLEACPEDAIRFGGDHALAARGREDLVVRAQTAAAAKALDEKAKRIFGRSLKLRQVSAGGCNACELDVNVLNTVVFDLGRFGIQFVASPRHADGLLVTGTVPLNMKSALVTAYEAIPDPKLVIAVGACAISGGPFAGHPEITGGVPATLPVTLHVPGCPPHPLTILDGLLRLLGRLPDPVPGH